MRFAFIKGSLLPQFKLCDCCRVLKVSASGLHRYVADPDSKRAQWRLEQIEVIRRVYHENLRVYGSHRIYVELRKQGIQICVPCARGRMSASYYQIADFTQGKLRPISP